MQNTKELYKRARQCGRKPAEALAMARAGKSVWPRVGAVNAAFTSGRSQYRWIENATALGWRYVGTSQEIAKRNGSAKWWDYPGYYADAYQEDIYRGAVLQLPARNGKPVYLSGYADPCNPDCFLVSVDTCSDEMEAARDADRIAERFAEEAREHSEAWSAVSLAIDNVRDRRESARGSLENVRELEVCDSPRIHSAILAQWCKAWEAYREAMAELSEALSNAKRYGITYREF